MLSKVPARRPSCRQPRPGEVKLQGSKEAYYCLLLQPSPLAPKGKGQATRFSSPLGPTAVLGLAWAVSSMSPWQSPGLPVCLALFSLGGLMSSRRQLQVSLPVAPRSSLAFPCTRASSLTPRTLDERPGFPLSQEIGFISPARLAAPERARPGTKLRPLVTQTPSCFPFRPRHHCHLLSTRSVPGT